MIRCEGCGAENPPGAAYCSACARKLDPETQETIVRTRQQHSAAGVRWSAVLAALIVLIAVIVIVALFATHVI
jgi:uncharacterized membrane protein YvbJ